MGSPQGSRFCPTCGRQTMHQRHVMISDGIGCLLTLITAGLFLLIWIPLAVMDSFQPWRCQQCGAKNGIALQGENRRRSGMMSVILVAVVVLLLVIIGANLYGSEIMARLP